MAEPIPPPPPPPALFPLPTTPRPEAPNPPPLVPIPLVAALNPKLVGLAPPTKIEPD
jgi:hypothetical protein